MVNLNLFIVSKITIKNNFKFFILNEIINDRTLKICFSSNIDLLLQTNCEKSLYQFQPITKFYIKNWGKM